MTWNFENLDKEGKKKTLAALDLSDWKTLGEITKEYKVAKLKECCTDIKEFIKKWIDAREKGKLS